MSNLNWTKHALLFLIRPVFNNGCFYTFIAFGSCYSLLFPPSSLSCKHGLRPEKLAHAVSHPGSLPCYGLALCQSILLFNGLMITLCMLLAQNSYHVILEFSLYWFMSITSRELLNKGTVQKVFPLILYDSTSFRTF